MTTTPANRPIPSVIQYLQYTSLSANQVLTRWANSFAQDPHDALEWATESFQAAGVKRVCEKTLWHLWDCWEQGLATQTFIDTIIDRLTGEVLRRSKYTESSTSPTANLVARYELAAYANILNEVKYKL